MTGTRGGRPASMPPPMWAPPARQDTDQDGLRVRFISEDGSEEKLFDFAGLPAAPALQRWLADAFVRQTRPSAGIKRLESAKALFGVCGRFARFLAGAAPPVREPAELTGKHVTALMVQSAPTTTARNDIIALRALLRGDTQLPESVRQAWANARLPAMPAMEDRDLIVAYTDAQWQLIMTAVRRDVRTARDRITEGRALLARYRSGALPAGSEQARLGALLDEFDGTGKLPRGANGNLNGHVQRAGGFQAVAGQLCPTLAEVTAFCLLLTALTGENFGTVAKWPASSCRPGGNGDGLEGSVAAVRLVEQVKPRRGPDREHAVVALEDLPRGLAGVLEAGEDDGPLMSSPARLYQLLVGLTELPRRIGGHHQAFSAISIGGVAAGLRPHHVQRWSRSHGFPAHTSTETAADAAAGSLLPAIDVRRIRQTVIEHTRVPVSHTRTTMNDHYLMRSNNVRDDSRAVAGEVLREQIAAARSVQEIPVFPAGFIARFRADPAVAAEAGLEETALRRLIDGESDTAVTACTDHLAGPATPAGAACTRSFLDCLDCANARALPRQLGVQLAMAEQIGALRPHLEPATWRARYQLPLERLHDIAGHYTSAERRQAQAQTTQEQHTMVADVLDGKWDLR